MLQVKLFFIYFRHCSIIKFFHIIAVKISIDESK
jgi:hypothetical protein